MVWVWRVGQLAGAPNLLPFGAGDLTQGIRLCCKPPSSLARPYLAQLFPESGHQEHSSLLFPDIFIGEEGRYGVRSATTNKAQSLLLRPVLLS